MSVWIQGDRCDIFTKKGTPTRMKGWEQGVGLCSVCFLLVWLFIFKKNFCKGKYNIMCCVPCETLDTRLPLIDILAHFSFQKELQWILKQNQHIRLNKNITSSESSNLPSTQTRITLVSSNQLMDQPMSVDTLWISQFVTGSLRELVGATISDHHPFICDCFFPSSLMVECLLADLCPDHLPFAFNSTCCVILDSVAPLCQIRTKYKPAPWFTDLTCSLRQQCRQAEWSWKDRLHVSLGLLKDSLSVYQRNLKEKKSRYVSSIIANSDCHLRVLFSTISTVLSCLTLPPQPAKSFMILFVTR